MVRPNQPTISATLKIITMGIALPPNQITSQQLDVQLNRLVDYVERRSGICWRYFARNDASQAELAVEALHDALVAAVPNSTDIGPLICASAIAAQTLPRSAIHILKAAAMPAGVAGFDINSSCVSFILALEVAAGLLNCGAYRRIAIVSADTASRGIDWDHEESPLISGDGAAYVIVERGGGRSGIIASLTETYPEGSELYEIRAGGMWRNPRSGVSDSDLLFHMQGKPLFRLTPPLIEDYFSRLLQRSGLQLDDIGTVVPHQAGHLSLEHMRKRLRVPEPALIDVYCFYGNQVAAFIPMALYEAVTSGRFAADKPVTLIDTAVGLTLADVMPLL